MNFQQGAYGPPNELTTLVRFWTIMEQLHYPTAAQIKAELQQELTAQREAARAAAAGENIGDGPGVIGGGGMPQQMPGMSSMPVNM